MKKKKILILDRFASESAMWLERQSHFDVIHSAHPTALPMDHLLSCHALLIRSRTLITEELLKKARQLQVIISATSGFDHIDLDACSKWGITVMHTPTANIESAAQLTWSLVLALASRHRESRPLIESGDWKRDQVVGLELAGHSYGIVGLGRIGSRVARLAQAFGMQVIAFDPYVPDSEFLRLGVQRCRFEDLFRNAPIVSFHVPKTAETEGMLQPHHLAELPRPVDLVNTSRGAIISESDLLSALKSGALRGAGLDVYPQEPLPPTSELIQHPHVILTPHIGANTEEAFHKASQLAAQKVVSFFLDGSTSETLPPRVPWYGATPLKAD